MPVHATQLQKFNDTRWCKLVCRFSVQNSTQNTQSLSEHRIINPNCRH